MITGVMWLVSHAAPPSQTVSFPLLYISPDQMLPITSLFGAVAGIALMFWNRVVGAASRMAKFCSRLGASRRQRLS